MDSWDYEESLGLLDYMPQSNNFLDIWQLEVSTAMEYMVMKLIRHQGAAKPIIQEGILDSENLDEYLSEVCQRSSAQIQIQKA